MEKLSGVKLSKTYGTGSKYEKDLAYKRLYMKALRSARRALGICTECDETREFDKTKCPSHLAKHAKWNREYRRNKKDLENM
jgi:hypothetical protein